MSDLLVEMINNPWLLCAIAIPVKGMHVVLQHAISPKKDLDGPDPSDSEAKKKWLQSLKDDFKKSNKS